MTLEDNLMRLLVKLNAVAEENEEIFDSEARERMGIAIMEGFVRKTPGYVVPEDLGMAHSEANKTVRTAIVEYINHANAITKSLGISGFHDRLAVFQNSAVKTDANKYDYEDFFGHTPPQAYDRDGNVVGLV